MHFPSKLAKTPEEWAKYAFEFVAGILAGCSWFRDFEITPVDTGDGTASIFLEWRRGSGEHRVEALSFGDRYTCAEDAAGHVLEAAESLAKEYGMSGKLKRDSTESMLFKCSDCDGKGEVEHKRWIEWRGKHRKDWRAALESGEVPDCEQWSECEPCHGTGMLPAGSAQPILDLIEWCFQVKAKV